MAKKRKDGRYQRKLTLSNGKTKFVYGRTLAELNAAEDAVRAEDRAGVEIGDHTLVGEWAKIWFDTYKSKLRHGTQRMYRDAYNCHIGPVLGSMELRDVRPVHAQKVMSDVADMSESLQRIVKITLRQIFQTARENHLILNDPTESLKITKHSTPQPKKHLTDEEAIQLMQSVTNPRARVLCGLCLYCGLRREEALGLQWSDISFNRLTVNRARCFIGNQPDPNQELKSKAAHRVIPIPRQLQVILEETPHMSEYIVTCADGREITLGAYRNLWAIHVRSRVDFPLHIHMLRHTYATTLYHAGVDLRTAQKLLGHASIQMTANIYTHLEQEDAMSVSDKLDSYYDGHFSKSSQKVVNYVC